MTVEADPCPRCGGQTEYEEPNRFDTVRACSDCPWKVLVSGKTGSEATKDGDRDD